MALDFKVYVKPRPDQKLEPLEQAKLDKKFVAIDKAMLEFGFEKGQENYHTALNKMVANNFTMLIKFLRRVEELEKLESEVPTPKV